MNRIPTGLFRPNQAMPRVMWSSITFVTTRTCLEVGSWDARRKAMNECSWVGPCVYLESIIILVPTQVYPVPLPEDIPYKVDKNPSHVSYQ